VFSFNCDCQRFLAREPVPPHTAKANAASLSPLSLCAKIELGNIMSVTIQIPADIEQRLRSETPNLEADARESLLVELYRQNRLSRQELAQALGLNRFETDGVLKRHRVDHDLPTVDELATDFQQANTLLGR
jgi:predicted HTH domain antitoxin